MTRVRPIASGQLSYDSELIWGLSFVHNWFGNGDGAHVAQPHPVNHFFYGCGGSHYSDDNPEQLVLLDSSPAPERFVREIDRFERYEEEEAALAKILGLRRCAYEGGVWTSEADYLLPRIEDAMVSYHALWDKYDNDLFVYYVSTGGEENGKALGFTQSAFNLDTPKYRALNTILSNPKASVSAGYLAPCIIPAADYSVNSTAWEHPAPGAEISSGGAQFDQWREWKGYLFRVGAAGDYDISLQYNSTSGSVIEIMVDGRVIAKESLGGTNSPLYRVRLEPGLHGLRVYKINDGYFMLNSVSIE